MGSQSLRECSVLRFQSDSQDTKRNKTQTTVLVYRASLVASAVVDTSMHGTASNCSSIPSWSTQTEGQRLPRISVQSPIGEESLDAQRIRRNTAERTKPQAVNNAS